MCSLTRPQLQLLYQRELEALKCGLDLFWPQKSNLFNGKTSSFLSQALTQTTTPIGIDDISEKALEMWEEMESICIRALSEALDRTKSRNSVECQYSHPTSDLVAASKEHTHAWYHFHFWSTQMSQMPVHTAWQSSQKSFKISGQGYSHLLQSC